MRTCVGFSYWCVLASPADVVPSITCLWLALALSRVVLRREWLEPEQPANAKGVRAATHWQGHFRDEGGALLDYWRQCGRGWDIRTCGVCSCLYIPYVCTYLRTPVCVVYGTCKKNITTRSIRTCLHIRPCVPPYVTSQTYTPVRKL